MKLFYPGFRLLALTLLAITSLAAYAQEQEEPIITIHSTAYQEVGVDNKFSIFLGSYEKDFYDIDFGAGLNEVEIEPGIINTTTGEFEGTWIPCRANADGIIKIYGDPLNLNIIKIDGAYIESIEMNKCEALEVISLQHNVLKQLDLTPFANAFAIYLSDNPFTRDTPLVIGGPKPGLAILEVDIIDHFDPDFNLSDYPALMTFDAYHNLSLKTCDPTGCPQLMVLSLEMTQVETLDVSKNPNLIRLNISESRIKDINLSKNQNLQHLLANHDSGTINTDVKLSSIDLSHNPNLTLLNLSHNDLTDIDLSHNTLLTNLTLNYNLLSSLDLSANKELYSVSLIGNDMDYATLPWPQGTWGEYFYEQRPMQVPRAIGVGQPLDLSERVLRSGTTTSAAVYVKPYDSEPTPLEPDAYTYLNGVITFNRAVADSVYVIYNNDVFSEYNMTSSTMAVKPADEVGKPSKIVSITMDSSAPQIKFAVGMSGASESAPKTFYLDFGDGKLQPFTTNFADEASEANVDVAKPTDFSGSISIYIPEEEVLTSLDVSGLTLYALDVAKATELRHLAAKDCSLYAIDLKYNRCLVDLNLANNNLYSLDLQGIYGNYEKFVLNTVDLSHNNLTEVSIVSPGQIKYLDLSHNNLESYTLKNYEGLDYLDLSYNKLSGEQSLTYQNTIKYLDLSHNNLSSLLIDKFEAIEHFDITNNAFTLATLPVPAEIGSGFIYAPQQSIQLEKNAPAVNLTAQNRVIDGVGTTFTWLKADGTPLVEGTEVECVDGATKFLDPDLGSVYCVMTNPAFPAFEGENAFTTTPVNVMGAPQNLVATFTTTENSSTAEVTFAGHTKTALYIDWRGDGTEYLSYPVETSYVTYPEQTTYAGATAKVYTYDSAEDISVFSLNGIKMSAVDLSDLSDVICIGLYGSGISEEGITLPDTDTLGELSITDSELSEYPYYGRYPNMYMLNLSNNKLTSFDASHMPNLNTLMLSANNISDVKFDNPILWNLAVNANALTSIDLNGLPQLQQIDLNNNKLSEIDINPVKKTLRVLAIAANQFTFASLPIPSDYPALSLMYYNSQADMDVQCVDGVIDLSAQAMIAGEPTSFTWYLGEAVFDDETGEWLGEQLYIDEEYTLTDGKTTFLTDFDDKVMCVMTNNAFPSLTLKTKLTAVTAAGVDDVIADSSDSVNVYTISGILIKQNVSRSEATNGLQPGLYIVGTEKVMVK